MEGAHINQLLPAEVLERVFRLLPPRVLRVVVLVCRRWREVGEAPGLWSWVYLTVDQGNLAVMPGLLAGRRLLGVVELRARAVSEHLLQVVADHPGLRGLDMSDANHRTPPDAKFPSLQANLLGAAVSNLTVLSIWETHLTTEQAEAVLVGITGSNLVKLDISYNDLSGVPARVLAAAVRGLEVVRIQANQLGEEQVEAVLNALEEEQEGNLKSLQISYNSLASVKPELLARLVARVEEVGLMTCLLTPHQLQHLFTTLSNSNSLRRLDISHNNLSTLEASLLAEVVNKLEVAVVNRTGLDQEQVTAVISRSLEATRLTVLCIEWRRIHVEEELVLQASELYDLTQTNQGTVAIY